MHKWLAEAERRRRLTEQQREEEQRLALQPQVEERRALYEDSLYEFLKAAWPYFDPSPWQDGWCIEALAEHLQAVVDGQITRLIVNIPPRTGKSSLLSVAFPAWCWAQRDRSVTSGAGVRFLFASYAERLSRRDSLRCARLMNSAWYQQLWGERFSLVQDSAIRLVNDVGGERLITSIPQGGATGEGADVFILDDANATNQMGDATVESTNEWWDQTASTRLNDIKRGAFINVQQRTGEEDLTGHILERSVGEWSHLCLPMRFEADRSFVTLLGRDEDGNAITWEDPRTKEGELLWPERFGEAEVAALERTLGPWACNPAEAPILMSDLTMKPIGDIRAGDEIVGFDKREQDPNRAFSRHKLAKATVLEVHRRRAPVVKITLEGGAVIRCTPDHKWFTKDRGAKREMYMPATLRSRLARICQADLPALTPTEERDAGWLSGFFDGEGTNFIKRREKVLSIEPDGDDDVFALTTTTGNYVVWGIASSNSAGQLQQRPEPKGGGVIKRDWWNLWRNDSFPPMSFILASLDTAFTEKTENDPSAMTVWGVFNHNTQDQPSRLQQRGGFVDQLELAGDGYGPGTYAETGAQVMLMSAWREWLEFHDLVEKVVLTCRASKVDHLLIEAKASGISVAQEIRRIYKHETFGVQLIDPKSMDKLARLHSTVPMFAPEVKKAGGKPVRVDGKEVILRPGIVYAPDRTWSDMVITEVGLFPKGKRKDLTDTVSQALRYLRDTGMLQLAPERLAELEEGRQFDNVKRPPPLYPA